MALLLTAGALPLASGHLADISVQRYSGELPLGFTTSWGVVGRIGDSAQNPGPRPWEVSASRLVGSPAAASESANYPWPNAGQKDWEITYSAATGLVTFSLDSASVSHTTTAPASTLSHLLLRVRSTTTSAVRLQNLVLDGTSLADVVEASSSVGTVNTLLITSPNHFQKSFVLKGKAKFDWSTSSPPTDSALLFSIAAGTAGGQQVVFDEFGGNLASADNSGTFTETFTGRVTASFPEASFPGHRLRVVMTGAASGAFERALTATDVATLAEPAFGTDGWKVWTGTENDGTLLFRFRYAYAAGAPVGTYSFAVSLLSSTGSLVASGPTDGTTLSAFSRVTVQGAVHLDGTAVSGGSWGGWAAAPGDTMVVSPTFLKLVNTGEKTNPTVVVDFTEAAFLGPDTTIAIPLNGNLRFAWWEDTTPATTSPAEGTYVPGSLSPDGSITFSFTGKGNVIYVRYLLASLPPVLPAQGYQATFTVTEV
ncbi:MAG TPA: choice-of-anchor W domain-containing protein [Candidatus Thermoplasmatota archaeon]|nr:choice-of-anchor W domain-containing protein [Candidatus Thermoplasmatota archaeon]